MAIEETDRRFGLTVAGYAAAGAEGMKVCALCGDVYQDHIEFCFIDGEVLQPSAAPGQIDAVSSPPKKPLREEVFVPIQRRDPAEIRATHKMLSPAPAPAGPLVPPFRPAIDPHTLALIRLVKSAVIDSVEAARKREQRQQSALFWRSFWGRYGNVVALSIGCAGLALAVLLFLISSGALAYLIHAPGELQRGAGP